MPTSEGTFKIGNLQPLTGTHYPTSEQSLVSVAQIVDEHPGATVTFSSDKATIAQGRHIMATGSRQPIQAGSRPLWTLDATIQSRDTLTEHPPSTSQARSVALSGRTFQHRVTLQTVQDKVDFLHGILGFPTMSTLTENLDLIDSFLSILGLTPDQVRKHAHRSSHTAAGHLKRTPAGFHSTKPTSESTPNTPPSTTEGAKKGPLPLALALTRSSAPPASSEGGHIDSKMTAQEDNEWNKGIHVATMTTEDFKDFLGRMFGDFTGDFHIPSFDHTKAVMIFFHEPSNYIKYVPITEGTSPSQTYQIAYQFFMRKGLSGTWFMADNAVSNAAKQFLTDRGVTIQLAPPHNHRANKAERMIQTAKDHAISTISGADPLFPITRWDHLLEPAELTLNLLRRSNIDPTKSAWEVVHGPYDLDKHPIMIAGTKAMVLEPREIRPSWGARSTEAFYIGPALQHYRSHRFITATGQPKVSDTAEWFPADIKIPGSSPEEQVIASLRSLDNSIKALDTTNHKIIIARPHLRDVIANLEVMFTGDRDRCAGCNKIFDDSDWDEWNQCRACTDWFCNICSGNTPPGPNVVTEYSIERDLKAAHELEVHNLQPEPRSATNISPSDPLGPKPQEASNKPAITFDDVKARKSGTAPPPKVPQRRRPPPAHDPNTYDKFYPAQPNTSTMPDAITDPQPVKPTGLKHRQHRQANMATSAIIEADEIAKETDTKQRELWDIVDNDIGQLTALELALKQERGTLIAPQAFALGAKVLNESGKGLSFKTATNPNYPGFEKWVAAGEKELHKQIIELKSMQFVPSIPTDRNAGYYRQVLEYNKEGQPRVRGTAGGDKTDLQFDKVSLSSRNLTMTAKKILLNKALSEGRQFATADISDFYVNPNHPLSEHQYIRINHNQMSSSDITKYGQDEFRERGFSYLQINTSVYGLEEAGANAQRVIVSILSQKGWIEEERSEKLMIFRHKAHISETLGLHTDDFAFIYEDNQKHVIQELIDDIEKAGYTLKVNWNPTHYCGMRIEYVRHQYVHVDIPGYVQTSLEKSGLTEVPEQNIPLPPPPKIMGEQSKFKQLDTSPKMSTEQNDQCRKVLGLFLYLAIVCRADIAEAVPQLISELSEINSVKTYKRVLHLAGYLKRNPDLGVTFYPSDMKLMAYTDSDFKTPHATTGGFFYLGRINDPEWVNGPIFVQSKKQPITTAAASEAEYIGAFMNGKSALPIRQTLDAVGYPQGTTPFKGDNAAAIGLATDTCLPRKSRYVDDKFHWFRDRVRRHDFSITWVKSEDNLADPLTKALSAIVFTRLVQYLATRSPTFKGPTSQEANIHSVEKSA